MCQQEINDEGVYIAGANRLYVDFVQGGKKAVKASDLFQRSLPLSCFLCCPLCRERSDGFIRFLSHYYALEIGSQQDRDIGLGDRNQIPGVHRELPSYIASFIESAPGGLPDWWEREYGRYLQGINSLVVYDARSRT